MSKDQRGDHALRELVDRQRQSQEGRLFVTTWRYRRCLGIGAP
jgi:hypothetical protein